MLLDMPPDLRCFLTVSYKSVNMAVPSVWAAGGLGHVLAIFASALLAAI